MPGCPGKSQRWTQNVVVLLAQSQRDESAMTRIVPRYKLIMQYNINPETSDEYYQFVVQELVPGMQSLGLYMFRVYHTAYGAYPIRQIEFLAETIEAVRNAFESVAWQRMEGKLLEFVSDYSRKTVEFRDGFQF